jgi:hypothetical protein
MKHEGLVLSSSKVEILAFEFEDVDFAPRTSREYIRCVRSTQKRAIDIKGTEGIIELSVKEVDALTIVLDRMSAYDAEFSAKKRYDISCAFTTITDLTVPMFLITREINKRLQHSSCEDEKSGLEFFLGRIKPVGDRRYC